MESLGQSSRTPAILLAICAALVIAGSVGPWARVAFFTVNGTDGDGTITLILGILACIGAIIQAMAASRHGAINWLVFVCMGIAFVVGAYDWANLADVADTEETSIFTIQVGWGLPVLTIFAFVGATVALAETLRSSSSSLLRKIVYIVFFGPVGVLALIVNAFRGPVITSSPAAFPQYPSPSVAMARPPAAFCRQCGTAVVLGDRFCGTCGQPL